MAESLREVIARMKAVQTNSQPSPKSEVKVEVPTPVPEVVKAPKVEVVEPNKDVIDDDFPDVENEDENLPDEPITLSDHVEDNLDETTQEIQKNQQIENEISLLQNDGIYRAHLLRQLQELNQGITVIAGLLVDLTQKK